MAKYRLDELKTADEVHREDLKDPEYRAEWERTALARAISELVVNYRVTHDITQTEFGRRVGLKQAHVSRLEAGDHNPSLETLARLAEVLEMELVLDITPAKRRRRGLSKAAASKTVGEFALGQSQVRLSAV